MFTSNNHLAKPTWYKLAVSQFADSDSYFLIFTDNAKHVRDLLPKLHISNYHIVEEDFANSLLLMTLCQHHIVVPSMFGYWGAYLDQKQPSGGRVYFQEEFLRLHFKDLPFKEWMVLRSGFSSLFTLFN